MEKPLTGVRVVDFSAVYAGPICARMLADCGADVVKIEPPGVGDITRGGPDAKGRVFVHFNAGKRGIGIDLANPDGQRVAKALIGTADVMVENYRPGVMAKFGLDYASLADVFPRLVYCSISGFGQTGPFAKRAAYAPIAHAASGYDKAHMRAQPDPDARPPNSGVMIADMLTGAYAFGAIQTALLGRARHGRGDYVDLTMVESMMMLIPSQVQNAQVDEAPRGGGFQPIKVADGYVMVCIVSPKNFDGLCRAIGRPELQSDPRFERTERFKNMPQFVAEIEAWSTQHTAVECEALLNETGVPCSLYNGAEDLFDHPQLLERGAFTRFEDDDGTFLVQNAPFRFAGFDGSTTPAAPMLGEHTDEVLAETLAMDPAEIGRLRASGAIK